MQFLFSTGSLYTYSIARCFDFAAQAGFDGIELLVDQRWDSRQPDFLQGLIDRFSLPILAIHSPFFAVPGWPAEQPALILESVKLAEVVGAQVVVHHLPTRFGYEFLMAGASRIILPIPGWNKEKGYRHWLEQEYEAVQADTEVNLCIENMPAKRFLGRRWSLYHWNNVEAIQRFRRLTMDTTHLGTWGLEPGHVYTRWQDRVKHVHLSNFDGREHRRPETGHLQLDKLLQALAADGYRGTISLELHPDALEAGGSDERLVELLSNSLAHCRAWVSQAAVTA